MCAEVVSAAQTAQRVHALVTAHERTIEFRLIVIDRSLERGVVALTGLPGTRARRWTLNGAGRV